MRAGKRTRNLSLAKPLSRCQCMRGQGAIMMRQMHSPVQRPEAFFVCLIDLSSIVEEMVLWIVVRARSRSCTAGNHVVLPAGGRVCPFA